MAPAAAPASSAPEAGRVIVAGTEDYRPVIDEVGGFGPVAGVRPRTSAASASGTSACMRSGTARGGTFSHCTVHGPVYEDRP